MTRVDPAKEHFVASVLRVKELPDEADYIGDCVLLVGNDGLEVLHVWDGQRWVNDSTVYQVQE